MRNTQELGSLCNSESCCLDCCAEAGSAFSGFFNSDCFDGCFVDYYSFDGFYCGPFSDCFYGHSFRSQELPLYVHQGVAVACNSTGGLAIGSDALELVGLTTFTTPFPTVSPTPFPTQSPTPSPPELSQGLFVAGTLGGVLTILSLLVLASLFVVRRLNKNGRKDNPEERLKDARPILPLPELPAANVYNVQRRMPDEEYISNLEGPEPPKKILNPTYFQNKLGF